MWNLPGPRIEPANPAMASGFFTPVPPGKSLAQVYFNKVACYQKTSLLQKKKKKKTELWSSVAPWWGISRGQSLKQRDQAAAQICPQTLSVSKGPTNNWQKVRLDLYLQDGSPNLLLNQVHLPTVKQAKGRDTKVCNRKSLFTKQPNEISNTQILLLIGEELGISVGEKVRGS